MELSRKTNRLLSYKQSVGGTPDSAVGWVDYYTLTIPYKVY